MVRRGLGVVARHRGAGRGIDLRLEGIRDGGDARRRRQRRHHLLDREFRSAGRPHRRLDHGGPGPDAYRQGISADARRVAGRDSRDRRRDRRIEHPVRDRSERRADDRDRDESARQPLQRAGQQGHRLPHRQDRGQAGRRLPAARAAQRHHARDDGLLRADHRLRGDQDSAVRLRKISRGRLDADHADEERRRDDGHRPHVQGVVPKGAARAWKWAASASAATARTCWGTPQQPTREEIRAKLARPNDERVWYLRYAIKVGHDRRRDPRS